MPNPTPSDVHVDRPLTNVAINWMQDQDKFLADQVFPYVGVDKQGGKYFEFDKDDLMRDEAKPWVSGTESAGSGYRVGSSSSYYAQTYAFHKDIGDDVRANADDPLQPDENATRFVTQKLLIQRENHFGSTFMGIGGTSFWGYENDPGTAWSLPGTGSPLDDLYTACQKIEKNYAWPTVGVFGAKAMQLLVRHDDFTDLYKHTQPGILTKDLIADTLDLEKIFVGKSTYATDQEDVDSDLSTASESFCIPQDEVLLLYVPDNAQIDIPSAGYTFGWEGLAGADGKNVTISEFRIDHLSVDRVEGKLAYDMKKTASGLGALLYSTLS